MATRESAVCDEFGRTYVRIAFGKGGFWRREVRERWAEEKEEDRGVPAP